MDVNGNPLPGYSDPSQCPGGASVPESLTTSRCSRPTTLPAAAVITTIVGHTDVKELALYIEDQIKAGNWLFNLGLRGDVYNGLTDANQAEPRVGIAYNIKPTSTVLRVSYARTLETPFNENLVLSSTGCSNAVLAPLLACTPGVSGTLDPGFRNEFHAGLQQAFGKQVVVSGEYIWKYTHNAFDFSILGNTPIFFPIDWHNSKIPGYALHVDVPKFHGFSAYVVMSSVAARFFPPQVGRSGSHRRPDRPALPHRPRREVQPDHAPAIHLLARQGAERPVGRLQLALRLGPGSRLGALLQPAIEQTPTAPAIATSTTLNGQPAVILSGLTADEEFQAGLACNGVKATPTNPLPAVCPASEFTSNLINIPAPSTGDNDHNPPRIAPRSLFDASLGKDNLFHKERYKVNLDLTAINVTDKYALYNFLSTFSGTHYVTPRALTAKITLNF